AAAGAAAPPPRRGGGGGARRPALLLRRPGPPPARPPQQRDRVPRAVGRRYRRGRESEGDRENRAHGGGPCWGGAGGESRSCYCCRIRGGRQKGSARPPAIAHARHLRQGRPPTADGAPHPPRHATPPPAHPPL